MRWRRSVVQPQLVESFRVRERISSGDLYTSDLKAAAGICGFARDIVFVGMALIHGFDTINAGYLQSLVSLRRKVRVGFRLEECLHLFKAVPLINNHTLRRR